MKELPATVKRSIELLGLVLLGYVLNIGSNVITPLLMAFFLSILLLPIHRFLMRKAKLPAVVAIFLSIVAFILVITIVIWFFTVQVAALVSDIPTIQKNLTAHWQTLTHWIEANTSLSVTEQMGWLSSQSDILLQNVGSVLGGAAVSLTGIFVFVGLLPIYIFLIIFYKNLLVRFVYLWFPHTQHNAVTETLLETESIVKSYLVGLLIQISYITILLGGLLAILGIKHALLIGVIFAILNLIPYVGALIGNIIGVLLTLTSTPDLSNVIWVLAAITAVQFLDNNILMPRIVGSKVKLNALVSILGVVIGGALAGVAGMFLSLPVMAVLKLIFDKTPRFSQWGTLLGETNPEHSPVSHPAFRFKSKVIEAPIATETPTTEDKKYEQ